MNSYITEKMALKGNCMLTPIELTKPNKEAYTKEEASMIDKMHKEKIKLSNRTLDHKIPLIRGGTHSKDNCVMACVSCNCSKKDKTDKEFLNYIYGKEKN